MTFDEYQSIVYTDLDGDRETGPNGEMDDIVINFNFIGCVRGNLWAGSGGAPIHFILNGDTAAGWTGGAWELVRFNAWAPVVILLARHGSACDGYGAQSCIQAITVDENSFMVAQSIAPLK